MVRAAYESDRLQIVLVCDSCGQPITHHGDGLVHLFSDGTCRVVHKTNAVPHCDTRDGDEGWLEIADFVSYLATGLGMVPRPEVSR